MPGNGDGMLESEHACLYESLKAAGSYVLKAAACICSVAMRHMEALDLSLSSQRAQDEDRHCGMGYWKAARDRPSKYKDLFYTGRVVGGCRHLIIQRGVNIIQSGERYGYQHLLHSSFTFPQVGPEEFLLLAGKEIIGASAIAMHKLDVCQSYRASSTSSRISCASGGLGT